MSDLIMISSSVLPDSARVIGFRGTEAISRPYEIEIFISLQQELGEELDLADGIGAKAKLILDRKVIGGTAHVFAGIFANLEILHAFDGRILLRATLVPQLWQLGLSRHSRIFTKMKVPDIIKAVLTENGVTDVELRLGAYEVEEHVSQYRESDLDFISRWMEREGIFYFFEHGEDGEKLVLCDQRLYDEDPLGAPVRFFPQSGHDRAPAASMWSWKCRHTTLPTSVRLKDYDYAKPSLNVTGNARVAENGAGEVSLYGERFFTPAAGDKLAKVRAEEMLARQVVYRGGGTRMHLRPGYTFELEEHPIASFNARYLTVEARHSGNQAAGLKQFQELIGIEHEDVYTVEVDAIPAKTQFRAASTTTWPRIYGYENGVVDGSAESDYAQIDDQGRYLCKFKYDESKLKGGKATTFVRMMQPHGGDIEGFHFPLRKGTEVVFSFMGGDCDRPVISGVVPNAINPSPVTSANHTKNVIQTGARNRLEIEDKAGSERITLSTPYSATYLLMGAPEGGHEMVLHTNDNKHDIVGKNLDFHIGAMGGGNWKSQVLGGDTTLDIPAGGYYIGTSEGMGVNSVGGVHFILNNDASVPTAPFAGGFYLYVFKEGIHLESKKLIFIKAQDDEIQAFANKKITIESETDDIFIHAKKKVTIQSDADQHVIVNGKTYEVKTEESFEKITADSHEIREANSFSEVHGNKFEKMFGNSESETHGTATSKFYGTKHDTFIGTKTEIDVSASAAFKLGASATASLSAQAELSASLKAAITLAIQLEIAFGLSVRNKVGPAEIEFRNAHIKAVQVGLENFMGPKIKSTILWLQRAGVHIALA